MEYCFAHVNICTDGWKVNVKPVTSNCQSQRDGRPAKNAALLAVGHWS